MKPENIEDIYELSPLQQGLIFHTLYSPGSGLYFEQSSSRIDGNFNVPAFRRAWQTIVDRHSVLRTGFHVDQVSKPLQVVHRRAELPFIEEDWSGVPPTEQQERLGRFLLEDRLRGFDLTNPPLARLALIRLSAASSQFVVSFHHAIMDGWSKHILRREISTFYEAYCRGQEPRLEKPRPYSGYIGWLQQQDLEAAERFWRTTLKGFASPTPLGIDRSPAGPEEYDTQDFRLSRAATTALQTLTRQHQLTFSTVVQGAWGLLLNRYSGEGDIVFGTVVSGRPPSLPGVESMVGLFINTLPVRVRVEADERLPGYLKRLHDHLVEMREYEYSPLMQVQGWSELGRGAPLFRSLVVFENYPASQAVGQAGSDESGMTLFERTNYPLTVLLVPEDELWASVLYDRRMFDKESIGRMLGNFRTLLEGMAARPDAHVADLPLLTAAERQQVLVDWNATEVEYPRSACVHELIDAATEHVAVECQGERLTYRELNARANQVAHYLRRMGARAESLVGICLDRSLEVVIAVLGVLKAGSACVPLDSAYPKARLDYMIDDAGLCVLLSRSTDWAAIAQESSEDPPRLATPDNLAYVIYTSGSTGRPKGVAMPHRPLVNLLRWQIDSSKPSPARTLQFAPLSFDVSFQEIFSTWCSGGTLVIASEETRKDPALLLDTIVKERVERLFLPFVALQQMAEAAVERSVHPDCLREIITAGEQLRITPEIASFFTALPSCRLENQYGPTESHVVTAFRLSDEPANWPALPPIGRPIANARVLLLDALLRPVPVGIAGDLYLGGDCLARGYLHHPELTEQKFISDPFHHEARLYRTGDVARWMPDGNLEFLGRSDDQVKVRGFRVEPGEIEAILETCPSVNKAAVAAHHDGHGGKHLAAYVVANNGRALGMNEVRQFLETRMPSYMVPARFVFLDELPLTPSGKVDRRALPAPEAQPVDPSRWRVLPETATEKLLAQIWEEVLRVKSVGLNDNFFELGGHSLLATRMASRVRGVLGIELPLRAVFEQPTIARLAGTVEVLLMEEIEGGRNVGSAAG